MNFVGYEYDLIGGKMLRVLYDSGMGDMFAHRYRYDEDNRLLTAETSRDGVLWDRDAEQEYYRHGPLRRLELGEDSIQGIDYTYTIHGWLKGINHAMLTSTSDPGLDGSFSNGMKYPLDGVGVLYRGLCAAIRQWRREHKIFGVHEQAGWWVQASSGSNSGDEPVQREHRKLAASEPVWGRDAAAEVSNRSGERVRL